MAKIKQLVENKLSNIQAVDENTLYSISDFPIGGITAEQMIEALLKEGFYQVGSVYLCTEGDETYYTNHCYKFTFGENNYAWVDITPWREIIDSTLNSTSNVKENELYYISDYPTGGITQEQMINALSSQQEGFYQINSVYMCIDDGDNYIKNHCYKFIPFEDGYQWEDITPWNEAVDTTLENLQTIDDKKLYSITDYPIGGITNSQMNDALTDAQEGFYQIGSVYMCTDEGAYLKNHFYKFNDLSWEDVTPEFAGELKDLTLEELESEVIDEDTLYNIKDYPIGGISSLQMVNALKPEQLGFYQVGSVYLCTDDYSDYIKHHFYRFNYDEETDIYSWVDTKAGADIDKELSLESENPVANKIVTEALEGKVSLQGHDDIYGVKSFESRPKLGIKKTLPEEYQEVEFIQTTGTQYIDTGIALSDNITKLETSYYRTTTGTRQILFGMYGGSCELYFEYTESGESYQRIYLNGTSLSSKVPVQIGKFNSSIEIKDSQLIYTTNGHSVSATYTNTNTSDTHCYLFADYSNGNPIYMYQCQLYSFRIWSGENLLREFIPCYRKEDNKVGLYDTVSELFYENIGTGEFLKGDNVYRGIDFATIDDVTALQPDIDSKVSLDKDEVIKGKKVFTERPQIGESRLPSEFTEVEYIEGSGVQYIDTGFGSSDGMNIQTKFSYTKIGRPLFGSHNLSSPYGRNYFAINSDGTFQLAYGNNLNLKVAGGLVNTIYNVDFQTRPTSAKLFVNGTEIINTSSGQSISNLSVIIFGVNYSITYNEEMASARIFNFKIFDINNNLVRDFIPCYTNTEVVNNETTYPAGTIGLYDLVENKFYTNQGTGEFLKGNDILSGEYLALKSEVDNALTIATNIISNNVSDIPEATENSPILIQFNGSLYYKQMIPSLDTMIYVYKQLQIVPESKPLVSFTINNQTLHAEQGMTWWKWLHSDYYDGSLLLDVGQGGYVIGLVTQSFLYPVDSSTIIRSDEIIANGAYILTSPGAGASLEI